MKNWMKIAEFCVFFCEPGLLLSTAHELAALKHSLQDAKLSRMSFGAPVAYHQPLGQIIPTNNRLLVSKSFFFKPFDLGCPSGPNGPHKSVSKIYLFKSFDLGCPPQTNVYTKSICGHSNQFTFDTTQHNIISSFHSEIMTNFVVFSVTKLIYYVALPVKGKVSKSVE